SSIDNKLNGLLLTLWDDDSPHFELYMRGIIAFAEYTWSGEKRTKKDIKSAYRQREFSTTLSNPKYAFIDQLESPVAFWKNSFLKGNNRNQLAKLADPISEALIDFPNKNQKGAWSKKHSARLEEAVQIVKECKSIELKIKSMKAQAVRNKYTLEVYEQVNKLVRFSFEALLTLQKYDVAQTVEEETKAIKELLQLPTEFEQLRREFESVYSETRILNKSKDYILDQDHHNHLANQSISFDWQFYAEILYLEKIQSVFK
ncbi:MAG: hypothetical protein L3J13_04110, partial [Devosiaceae bacterium]|nr:hypothetical protein [Devosiaceae bacterium]